jgi:hypothetical protein
MSLQKAKSNLKIDYFSKFQNAIECACVCVIALVNVYEYMYIIFGEKIIARFSANIIIYY